jgi:hypothetical protein
MGDLRLERRHMPAQELVDDVVAALIIESDSI